MGRIIRVNDIIDEVQKHYPQVETSLIEKAYVFAAQAHKGQNRLNGEPYLSHPLEVAYILAQMGMEPVTVASGLLHDTVEDTVTSLDELQEYFGDEVTDIVNGVTKVSQLSFSKREEQQAETIRKMILAMAYDIRVILVKLADRVHNMRTLGYLPPESQQRIAQETLDIFAPIAGRLGMRRIRSELEDLAFYYLEPEIYQQIQEGLARKRGQREAYIREISELIRQKLAAHHLKGEVSGRSKHLYGIYRKMQKQQISLEQVYDVVAFRIILETIQECYAALGLIHSLWQHVPGRIKDYITRPKSNGYQSLHTTVIGPYGERMEIQIRTQEMHQVAEEGIAAHWCYKESRAFQGEDQCLAWLRRIIEWQKYYTDPQDFLKTVRLELYPEDVFVFTPQGDVKELPRGATPVDFAYAIHTEVGHTCTGAKVNGRMVSLKYKLQTGDTVEIITNPHHVPSRDWLQFVRTPRARSKIKQWLKTAEQERSITLGKEILDKELRKAGLALAKLLKSGEELQKTARELSFVRIDDLLAAVGYGKISAAQVINKLLPRPEHPSIAAELAPTKPEPRARARERDGITVKGVEDILIHLAQCCNPIPGDPITGYITRGKGITIHRTDCPYLARTESIRHIAAEWDGQHAGRHPVRIQVVSLDKPGLLADITAALKTAEANVTKANIETTVDQKGICWFTIEVADTRHLAQVFNQIKRVKDIISVSRVTT